MKGDAIDLQLMQQSDICTGFIEAGFAGVPIR